MSDYTKLDIQVLYDLEESLQGQMKLAEEKATDLQDNYLRCLKRKTHCDEVEWWDEELKKEITEEQYAQNLDRMRKAKADRKEVNKEIGVKQRSMSEVQKELRRRRHALGGSLPPRSKKEAS
jgi:hypothetical protein